jgi:hypothetical protein
LPYGSAAFLFKHENRDALSYHHYREDIKEKLFATMFNMRIQEISQEPNPP